MRHRAWAGFQPAYAFACLVIRRQAVEDRRRGKYRKKTETAGQAGASQKFARRQRRATQAAR